LRDAQTRAVARDGLPRAQPRAHILRLGQRAADTVREIAQLCSEQGQQRTVVQLDVAGLPVNAAHAAPRVRYTTPDAQCGEKPVLHAAVLAPKPVTDADPQPAPSAASARLESDTQPKMPPCALTMASAAF